MRVVIHPYKNGLHSVAALKEAIKERGVNVLVLKADSSSKYQYKENDFFVNWGSSDFKNNAAAHPHYDRFLTMNRVGLVGRAIRKDSAFISMRDNGVSVPAFWTNVWALADDAELQNERRVVIRHKLTGHSGEGAEIRTAAEIRGNRDAYENVALFTEYVPKMHEYRLHIYNGTVLLVQQKKRDTKIPDNKVNWEIRNNSNGFIYAINDIVQPHQRVVDTAIAALQSVQLNYGAVDVIWNDRRKSAYALEVNTAPGLESPTLLTSLADQIISHGYESLREYNERFNRPAPATEGLGRGRVRNPVPDPIEWPQEEGPLVDEGPARLTADQVRELTLQQIQERVRRMHGNTDANVTGTTERRVPPSHRWRS